MHACMKGEESERARIGSFMVCSAITLRTQSSSFQGTGRSA